MTTDNRGLTLIYTGNGKGKTSAAVGLAVRAAGYDQRVGFFQFIKSEESFSGEIRSLERLGVEVRQLGIGFTWEKTVEEQRASLDRAWKFAKERIFSGEYDLIVLDELNYALAITGFKIDDVLPLSEVVQVLKDRPQNLHIVITGRGLQEELLELADLVSEIEIIKHYYNRGLIAVEGIDL
jgi:cob(I)alamin adenosyltransferase